MSCLGCLPSPIVAVHISCVCMFLPARFEAMIVILHRYCRVGDSNTTSHDHGLLGGVAAGINALTGDHLPCLRCPALQTFALNDAWTCTSYAACSPVSCSTGASTDVTLRVLPKPVITALFIRCVILYYSNHQKCQPALAVYAF